MSQFIHDDELKLRITSEWDVTDFLDCVGWSFEDLIDIVFDELNEEQRQELERVFTEK